MLGTQDSSKPRSSALRSSPSNREAEDQPLRECLNSAEEWVELWQTREQEG